MKLTKKLEAEIRKLYEVYWNSYINGDLETYASLLDEEFKFIGSTEAEPLLNKKDSIKLLDAVKEQMAGKAEFRNRNIKVELVDELVLVSELCDGYILIGTEWNFYSRFRLSSLLKKKRNKWKFIHQHVSMPDSKAQEGEAYGLEQIRTENIQLRDAVKRRTIELENKNRELEIEAALERVRARTMAMQRSDELMETAVVLFDQLKQLGENIERTIIGVVNEEERVVDVWATRPDGSQMVKMLKFPIDEPIVMKKVYGAWRQQKKSIIIDLHGEELESYFQFLKGRSSRLKRESLGERRVESFAFFSKGMLGVINADPNTPANVELYERFAAVFEQTYTRFLDLQKAEAQAREAKIEAALEKVRSRTIGMQRSEELKEAAQLLFQQVQTFGVNQWACGYNIWEPDGETCVAWMSRQGILQPPFKTSFSVDPCFRRFYDAKQRGDIFYVEEMGGEEIKGHYKRLLSLPEFQSAPQEFFDEFIAPEFQIFHIVHFAHGYLMFITYEPVPQLWDIFKRFGKVFEQTYTRFLDLQKSEAQARESQIQLALERVRARTMAMQKSDELPETSFLLFQQVKELGETTVQNSIGIVNEETGFVELSTTVQGHHLPHTLNVPINDPYVMAKAVAAWKAKRKSLKLKFEGQELKNYNEHRNSFFETKVNFPEDQWIVNIIFFSKGWLSFSSDKNIPDETFDLLKRFAAVFEQAYTRFNDLKQAEEQARESQIQLAMERVRARTMAMQKSDELTDVAGLLFEQVSALGIKTWTAGFNVWSEDNNSYVDYITSPQGGFIEPYTVYTETAEALTDISNARKSGVEFDVQYVEGEKIKQLYLALTKLDEKQYEIMLQDGVRFPSHQYEHFVFGSKVSLMFITYEPVPEAHDIFKRLGKVFEQTYTRFLDLQKAEEQARESQIQLALERVRARTMAMQHSDELKDAAALLFQQVKALGVPAYSCGYNIWEKNEKTFTSWMSTQDGSDFNAVLNIPLTEDANFIRFAESREKGEQFFVSELRDERMQEHYEYLKTIPAFKAYFDYAISVGFDLPETQIHHLANFSQGNLLFITLEPCPEFYDVFKRFAGVFEQTYTRFLDLQKAEAQAREAKIEAALEKVRSRSLAMHHSDELEQVVLNISERLVELGLSFDGALIFTFEKSTRNIRLWIASNQLTAPIKINLPYDQDIAGNLILKDLWNAIETRDHIFNRSYSGKAKDDYFLYVARYNASIIPEAIKIFHLEAKSWMVSMAAEKNSVLAFDSWSGQITTNEDFQILKRFAKVFEQSYTRFLDLQKAEAQAREAQIETALEKVRSRTMAMHKSDELAEVATVLFEQMTLLDNTPDRFNIRIANEAEGVFEFWATDQEGHLVSKFFRAEFDKSPVVLQMYTSWKAKEKILIQDLYGDQLSEWVYYIKDVLRVPFDLKHLKEHRFLSSVFFSHGMIGITTNDSPHPDTLQLIGRFAKVFEQTYTRFLDLQKAEAQAKEAKIEAALEKVRASTMAMQRSDDLSETAFVLFKQFKELGEAPERIFIATFDDEQEGIIDIWGTNQGGNQLNKLFRVSADEPTVICKIIAAWKEKKRSVVIDLSGEELKQYISFLKSTGMPVVEGIMEDRRVQTIGCFSKGVIGVTTPEPQSAESVQLLERFAGVFDLTYTRFLDLQQAETQAREARIETALERVRSNTMAMHHSEELKEVISVTFEQLKSLNIIIDSCIINLFIDGSHDLNVWVASAEQKYPQKVRVPYLKHPLFDKTTPSKNKAGNSFTLKLSQKENQDFYKHIIENSDFGKIINEDRRKLVMNADSNIMSFANFKHTGLRVGNFRDHTYTQEENNTILRFANVFEQTYTRFLDLQKAEAQAREVVKQASVDRVRAEIASMRTTNDLERITPLIWNELKTLGVPFIRCGVFIIDEEQQQVHTFLSTPDGKANASFTSAISTVSIIAEALPHWRRKEMYKAHWDEATFIEQTKHLVEHGAVSSTNTYLTENRPKDLYLHLLPFLQGILYVGNETPLNDDELQLVQNLADAFAIAYARYEDFNKLELAKEQIENTLIDLKQTQAQLVQSEKMASLGELTAGIAHEIQNPLNFVNNFSEVNKELLAEMNEEIEKGNLEEAKALAKDVIDNEEKINHHGKRADAIVKGMLQHSRSSSGVKEPSDINVLADEYLRLAYHGLRAKDKSFNATMKTDFDETIGKINIVPQDVGRSVLNLITNAFYAVSEKKKQNGEGYEPTVTVTTKRINGKVEIRVADNGNGIPQKVLDKIFQPFFTTKPTGEGTGLGLSLSYDIVKAHNGELKVETNEGQGSAFIIFLPANN